MRIIPSVALLAGFCLTASADIINTYSDSIPNNTFASSTYELTADNRKNITAASFGDGSSTQSAFEIASTPNMNEPGGGGVLQLLPGEFLVSAEYDLGYDLGLNVHGQVTDLPGVNRSQTDPDFNVGFDNFRVELVFKDINGNVLDKENVTGDSSVDLMPFLMDGGAIENAFETTGVSLVTRFRADDVFFTADLLGYDPANNPDRNVIIDYTLKEKLSAGTDVTIDIGTPEPATLGLLSLGLVGLIGLGRKFRT